MELEIQKDYLDNLKKQSELQNIVYDDINNDQKILNDLYNHAKETNTLFQENKRLMNLLIARLNEPINNEEFLELQSFANTLTDFFMSKDAEFAFLIHSKLLEVAKKNKDLNLTVEELYYNFKCAYSISRVYGTNLYEHLYDNLDYYIAHYFELDKKNRELFLKFYANQTISIKEPENNYYKESIDVALNYINFARRKDVREKDPDFHFALFEQTVKRNIAKYITLMVQNIKIDDKYQKVIFDAVESTYNDYKNKSEMMKFPSPELEAYRYQILRYLRNEITFKDLLDFVNGLVIKYQDSDETLKSISSAFHYRAILVVLVKNYAKMDENEKRTFIDQIVKDALIYLKHLKKTEFVNYAYKGYFDLVCAVSFFEDGSHDLTIDNRRNDSCTINADHCK